MANEVLLLIGRIVLGFYFMMSGFMHFKHLKILTGFADSKEIPSPKFSVIVSGLFLLAGGLSILFWKYQIIGMVLIIAFLIPASFLIHNFWRLPKKDQQADMVNFMKNIALVGALLMLIGM